MKPRAGITWNVMGKPKGSEMQLATTADAAEAVWFELAERNNEEVAAAILASYRRANELGRDARDCVSLAVRQAMICGSMLNAKFAEVSRG